jgi:molybdate transport system substrate-binding protein
MKILCTQALEGVFHAILPHVPGDSVIYNTTGGLIAELEAGQGGDLLLASRPALDELALLGKIEAGSLADIASTPVGIGVKKGVGVLDLSSIEAVKKLLLAAGPIAYPEPSGGGVSGIHFAEMLDKLGIAEEVNRHAILVKAGGVAARYVMSGQAGMAVQMISELMIVEGIEVAGTLPGEFAKTIAFSGAVVAGTAHAREALDVIQALKTPAAREIMKGGGLTPAP